jgi:hypothetical protein
MIHFTSSGEWWVSTYFEIPVAILSQDRIFIFGTTSRPALGSTQPSIQWYCGYFVGVKRPEREDNHSPPSSDVANAWRHTSTPPYVCMAWCLNKFEGQLYLYLDSFLLLAHWNSVSISVFLTQVVSISDVCSILGSCVLNVFHHRLWDPSSLFDSRRQCCFL